MFCTCLVQKMVEIMFYRKIGKMQFKDSLFKFKFPNISLMSHYGMEGDLKVCEFRYWVGMMLELDPYPVIPVDNCYKTC